MQAKLTLDKDFSIGKVDERLYGSFIEHLGRAVYTGIFEPGHGTADEQGFRRDVMDLIRKLQIPIIRYPGGNFVSGYRWTDGIGPKDKRPRRLDYAWTSLETNQFGIDEFADWCKKAGTHAMVAVNLGTGTPQQAADLVEYCNFPGGTYWSDLRIANGHKEPHNFRVWCLGNEMDGPWQTCAKTADEYGHVANEAAKMMKWVDPTIELVACGSSSAEIATYPEWDRKVLEWTYDNVDFLSMHRYYGYKGDVTAYLASYADLDAFLSAGIAAADYVKAYKRSKKVMKISLDEWNAWYCDHGAQEPWTVAPALEEQTYNVMDALCVGGLLCTMINRSDRVRMGCLAQLVNCLAIVMTEPGKSAYAQTTYYPFLHASLYGRGEALRPLLKAPKLAAGTGEFDALAAAATFDEEKGEMTVFALNLAEEAVDLHLSARSFANLAPVEHIVLDGDLFAQNTFAEPEKVLPHSAPVAACEKGESDVKLPARSWNVLRFSI